MKEVINNLTGEVIELPEEENELLIKEMNALITDDVLETYYQLEAINEKIETWKYQIKDQVKEIFKKYNIKSFKGDYMTITYVPEHSQKRVDTELMKKAGIYNDFLKETNVKESIRIGIKNDRD